MQGSFLRTRWAQEASPPAALGEARTALLLWFQATFFPYSSPMRSREVKLRPSLVGPSSRFFDFIWIPKKNKNDLVASANVHLWHFVLNSSSKKKKVIGPFCSETSVHVAVLDHILYF